MASTVPPAGRVTGLLQATGGSVENNCGLFAKGTAQAQTGNKAGWGAGETGALTAPWGTLEAQEAPQDRCRAGGRAEGEARACPAPALQAVPWHPVSGRSRPEEGH